MKTPNSREGNVLIITLGLLTAVCAFAGVTLSVTSHTARNIDRSRDFAQAQAAAEGALEYAYAVWSQRIGRGEYSTEDVSEGLVPPAIPGIKFDETDGLTVSALDAYGVATANGVPVTGRVPGYQGWSGRTRNYAATARVKLDDGTTVGVRRLFQYTEVPLFQAMFFFQHDLELYRPARMMVNGLVHSNGRMYMVSDASNIVTLQGNVTYTTSFAETETPYAKYWSGYDKNAKTPPQWQIGKAAQLSQVPPIQPMGGKPEEVFNTTDNNPNNDGYRELIEPPVAGKPDPEAIASRRLINKAGLVIEINEKRSPSIQVTAKGGAYVSPQTAASIRNAITKVHGKDRVMGGRNNTVEISKAQGLRDAREMTSGTNAAGGGWVDVSTVDIKQLKDALGGVQHFNNVIYIHDTTPRDASDPEPKAIRLVNGKELPEKGLTIASENPVYIQGDYNTGVTATGGGPPASGSGGNPQNKPEFATVEGYERKPAAVIADAVMFLSNAWEDVNSHTNPSNAPKNRNASNTTYNVAVLAGYKPSEEGYYAGGANNFPRFLENWEGKYCTYFGSMVELFESETFNGRWDTGKIYLPPIRAWNFDTKFLTTPPPGSVEAVVLNRGPWSRL